MKYEFFNEIINLYNISSESHRLVSVFLKSSPERFPADVVFATKTLAEAESLIVSAQKELDDFTIVSLWAVFEQIILTDIIESIYTDAGKHKNIFKDKKKISKLIESWNWDDKLDLYKTVIDGDIVGQVKQVKDYRNWVAHGKSETKPLNIKPFEVKKRLEDFLIRLSV